MTRDEMIAEALALLARANALLSDALAKHEAQRAATPEQESESHE